MWHLIRADAQCALPSSDLCCWSLRLPSFDLRRATDPKQLVCQAQDTTGSGSSANPAAAGSPHITGLSSKPMSSSAPEVGGWVLTVGARRRLLSTLVEVEYVAGLSFRAFSKTQGCTRALGISSDLGTREISVSNSVVIILLFRQDCGKNEGNRRC